MTKTLKDFLEKHKACIDGYEYAKDMTLEEFWNKCQHGDWMLWLFVRTNPDSVRERVLAAGHCANTVRHLMEDKRSIKGVDAAIAFGEGKISKEELLAAAADARAADGAAWAAWAADDMIQNLKQTADICRKFLPLEIWNSDNI